MNTLQEKEDAPESVVKMVVYVAQDTATKDYFFQVHKPDEKVFHSRKFSTFNDIKQALRRFLND